jgi:hypothetical protein
MYIEASAKTGENVELAFRELLKDTRLKQAVSTRLTCEKEENTKLQKSKSKKSKTELLREPSTNYKALTADANVDWRVIRMNQLLISILHFIISLSLCFSFIVFLYLTLF